MNDEVALIAMPFAAAGMPSIGISLLQAELKREGIGCDIYYPNLDFASHVGIPLYSWLTSPSAVTLTGEWIFSHLLFPDQVMPDEAYRKEILLKRLPGEIDLRTLLEILKAKKEAAQFLDHCLSSIDFSRYRIVGFTSTFEQNVASLALARLLKEKYPEIVIVFGGANCEAQMGIELHRQFRFVDYVCSGEGDRNFPELVKRIFRGESACDLDGIIARRDAETVIPLKLVSPVTDLDELPIPSYDDYFAQLRSNRLEGQFEPMIPIETARGCWWGEKMHCTFCGLNGSTMAYRSKSPARVLEEISVFARKYGTKFVSVDNILNLKYLDSVFPEVISRGLNCTFYFETKVNLKKRQLKLLSEAGVNAIQPGIESLSTPILKSMKKGCTMLQNLQFLKWAKQYGIKTHWNLLYGFPGEDPTEYKKMAQLIPSLYHFEPPEASPRVHVCRFSPYFTQWREFGFRQLRADRSYSFVYALPQAALDNLAYTFEFDHELDQSVESYAGEVLEAVSAWQSRAPAASLTMKESGGDLLLIDSRKPGPAEKTTLHEPLSTIYQLCDEAMGLARIWQSLPACNQTTLEEVGSALDSLCERGLMAKEGSVYLSLAIPLADAGCDQPILLSTLTPQDFICS
ncbi:MAG: RiPP maturation radical SAM C-methyltransferase [Candidatus Acidiferrales bacterium]